MRVHDQFHPETKAFAGTVHDEQRFGEFHNIAGELIETIVDEQYAF